MVDRHTVKPGHPNRHTYGDIYVNLDFDLHAYCNAYNDPLGNIYINLDVNANCNTYRDIYINLDFDTYSYFDGHTDINVNID